MSSGDLNEVYMRIARAKVHRESLEEVPGFVIRSGMFHPVVRTQLDSEGLVYGFNLGMVTQPPPEVAAVAGECLYCLRSALDHLAFQLHLRRYRGRVPVDVERVAMFPILKARSVHSYNGTRRLGQRDRTALAHLQPTVNRDDTWTLTRRWLATLDELHNIDKHRKLNITTAYANYAIIPAPVPEGFRWQPSFGPVQSHSEVDRWIFATRPDEPPVHLGVPIDVAVQYGSGWESLIPALQAIENAVTRVVDRFANRFP